jgi:hypothetical protein
MKKGTNLNWQKQLLFAALASVAVLLVAIPPIMAQDQWDKGDEWRAQYKVGDSVQFSISDRASDFQKCKVSSNEPGVPMRVECDAFKQWMAGSYIVYGKSSIRSMKDAETKTETKKEPASNTNSKLGSKQTSAQKKWDSGDEWRGEFEVGDKIQFSISGRSADFQTCTVVENDPDRVMRVKCDAFKQWEAGSYIVHAKYYVRTKNDGPNRKEPEPAFNKDNPNKGNPNKQAPAGLKVGEYACYGVGGRIMIGLGFKVLPDNRYKDLDGKNSGSFSVVGDTVRFRGGHLDGQTGRNLRGHSFTIGKQAECEPY